MLEALKRWWRRERKVADLERRLEESERQHVAALARANVLERSLAAAGAREGFVTRRNGYLARTRAALKDRVRELERELAQEKARSAQLGFELERLRERANDPKTRAREACARFVADWDEALEVAAAPTAERVGGYPFTAYRTPGVREAYRAAGVSEASWREVMAAMREQARERATLKRELGEWTAANSQARELGEWTAANSQAQEDARVKGIGAVLVVPGGPCRAVSIMREE